MKPIPPEYNNKFLLYLNDFIQDSVEYFDVCAERKIKSVMLDVVGGMDYVIIDFVDGASLIIPKVYSQFEITVQLPPNGAA